MVETASQSASSAAASDRKTDDNPFKGVLAQLLRTTGVIDCITTTCHSSSIWSFSGIDYTAQAEVSLTCLFIRHLAASALLPMTNSSLADPNPSDKSPKLGFKLLCVYPSETS